MKSIFTGIDWAVITHADIPECPNCGPPPSTVVYQRADGEMVLLCLDCGYHEVTEWRPG